MVSNRVYNELFKEYIIYVGLSNDDVSCYIAGNNLDEEDGMHVWYEFVVTPIVLNAIKNNDNNILTKSFKFIEECLKSDDKDVTEVIEFSLLEGIIAGIGEDIKNIDLYFGDETMKSIDFIKKYIFSN